MTPTLEAITDIQDERYRQIRQEGFSEEKDDEYGMAELSRAALCYVHAAGLRITGNNEPIPAPLNWPWDFGWWKPTTARRNLVKAAALIVAEIERIDRAEAET